MIAPGLVAGGRAWVQLTFLAACLLTVLFIFRRPYLYVRMGRRHIRLETYFLGALLAPAILILSGLVTVGQAAHGLRGGGGLNPLGILALFLAMVFMSIFLDITGFFEYCARVALRVAKGSGRRLFFTMYAAVSVLTVFTSNDIIILTFTPFIYYFTRSAGVDPKPYLIAEFFAANTWSMMLYIGNPTNILLASAFDVKFATYFLWMLLPTVVAGAVNLMLLYALFRKEIDHPLRIDTDLDPMAAITDRRGALFGLCLLGTCIAALAIAPCWRLEMWTVALVFGLALLVLLAALDVTVATRRRIVLQERRYLLPPTLRRMPWSVVPFLLSLFVTVEALRLYGVTAAIGEALAALSGGSGAATVALFGTLSALAANVLNNIPMTVAFVPITACVPGEHLLPAALATAIGSNLGANLTPIGALAGIMWMSILKGCGLPLPHREFIRCGLIVTPAAIAAALGVLAIEAVVAGTLLH